MVELSGIRRRQYATYQPVFWREAEGSDEIQRPFFEAQIVRELNIAAVALQDDGTISGFIIATLCAAPPVYAPGGLTCVVDDFAVEHDSQWREEGTTLLDHIAHEAKQRGAVQTVVVCPQLDAAKKEMLLSGGSVVASEWYVKSLG